MLLILKRLIAVVGLFCVVLLLSQQANVGASWQQFGIQQQQQSGLHAKKTTTTTNTVLKEGIERAEASDLLHTSAFSAPSSASSGSSGSGDSGPATDALEEVAAVLANDLAAVDSLDARETSADLQKRQDRADRAARLATLATFANALQKEKERGTSNNKGAANEMGTRRDARNEAEGTDKDEEENGKAQQTGADAALLSQRVIPLVMLTPSATLKDTLTLVRLVRRVFGHRTLLVVAAAAIEGDDHLTAVALPGMLQPHWQANVSVLRVPPTRLPDSHGGMHTLHSTAASGSEGLLVQAAVEACLQAMDPPPDPSHDSEQLCIVLRCDGGDDIDSGGAAAALAPAPRVVAAFARYAVTMQHAVPFVCAMEAAPSQVVSPRLFAVTPLARHVPLDAALPTSGLVFLDAALFLRTTVLGFLLYDGSGDGDGSDRRATVPFSFLHARQVPPPSGHVAALLFAKWKFNITAAGGSPSGMHASVALDPLMPVNGTAQQHRHPAAYLACLARAQQAALPAGGGDVASASVSSSACVYDCQGDALCGANDTRFVTKDLLTLAKNPHVAFGGLRGGAVGLWDRLERLAQHMIGRLKLAQRERQRLLRDVHQAALKTSVNGSASSAAAAASVPIVPLWGSLIVAKDFGYWLNLTMANTEVAVERYVVLLNRADARIHFFMTLLSARIAQALPGIPAALCYEYHPENLGIADGWNRIGEIGFDGSPCDTAPSAEASKKMESQYVQQPPPPPPVGWMIVMNNDVALGPSVLRTFAIETERLHRYVATNNIEGFTAFAITRLGWREVGHFDANLWPAYGTDVEYTFRMKSRGLLRADHDATDGDGAFSHVESVTLRAAIPSEPSTSDNASTSTATAASVGAPVTDILLRKWVDRWARTEYIYRKWGINIWRKELKWRTVRIDDFPVVHAHPFGVTRLPHVRAGGCIEPDFRRCIQTFHGVKHLERPTECFFNITSFLMACGGTKDGARNEGNARWRRSQVVAAAGGSNAIGKPTQTLPAADVPLGALPWWRQNRTKLWLQFLHVPFVNFTVLAKAIVAPAMLEGQQMIEDLKSAVAALGNTNSSHPPLDPEMSKQVPSTCFIPILVLAVFRQVDGLHAFLTQQPCAIGALVLRAVGPDHRVRHRVSVLARALGAVLYAKKPTTTTTANTSATSGNRTAAAVVEVQQRPVQAASATAATRPAAWSYTFFDGRVDIAVLPKTVVSVGSAFRDAMRAKIFADLLHGDTDPCRDENESNITGKKKKTTEEEQPWQRWALFVDVEHQLTDAVSLARLARRMHDETTHTRASGRGGAITRTDAPRGNNATNSSSSRRDGNGNASSFSHSEASSFADDVPFCRRLLVATATQNVFAASIPALRFGPAFTEPWGYRDVGGPFVADLSARAIRRNKKAAKAGEGRSDGAMEKAVFRHLQWESSLSAVSGYDVRSFEPFNGPPV